MSVNVSETDKVGMGVVDSAERLAVGEERGVEEESLQYGSETGRGGGDVEEEDTDDNEERVIQLQKVEGCEEAGEGARLEISLPLCITKSWDSQRHFRIISHHQHTHTEHAFPSDPSRAPILAPAPIQTSTTSAQEDMGMEGGDMLTKAPLVQAPSEMIRNMSIVDNDENGGNSGSEESQESEGDAKLMPVISVLGMLREAKSDMGEIEEEEDSNALNTKAMVVKTPRQVRICKIFPPQPSVFFCHLPPSPWHLPYVLGSHYTLFVYP